MTTDSNATPADAKATREFAVRDALIGVFGGDIEQQTAAVLAAIDSPDTRWAFDWLAREAAQP